MCPKNIRLEDYAKQVVPMPMGKAGVGKEPVGGLANVVMESWMVDR